jgi:formylglycine-generating enzyme required for sulfatase activity
MGRVYFILFILLAVNHFAQSTMRIEGKGELKPNEKIDKVIRDAEGKVCAGLIIERDDDGFVYDSEIGIVKVVKKNYEDFLFLSSEEKVITVYKNGYKPLEIKLSDFGIVLKKEDVWKLKLVSHLNNELVRIKINVNQPNYNLFIDEKAFSSDAALYLTYGKHKLKIEKEGFKTVTEDIFINKNNTNFEYKLIEEKQVKVTINSDPKEANIYINNIDKGLTNKDLFLFPGSYQIKLVKKGYFEYKDWIKILDGEDNIFNYNLKVDPSTIPGVLKLLVSPADANILINNEKRIGKEINLLKGKYKIEIKKDGYFDYTTELNVEPNKIYTIDITLKPRLGNLFVEVEPNNSEVIIRKNNAEIQRFTGAKIIKDLPCGQYELTVSSAGFIEERRLSRINEKDTTYEKFVLVSVNSDIKMPESMTVQKYNKLSDNMVFVKGGTFEMGNNNGYDDEKPVHTVFLDDFYICKYEVSQAEWIDVMGNNPSYFKGEKLPVTNVSWNMVDIFIKKLNEKTGKKYRLPTEAEWEYAAKGGALSKGCMFSGSNSYLKVGWIIDNSEGKIKPVGSKEPNELGIFDMTGNVWEWCADWSKEDYYVISPKDNPLGPSKGDNKVFRGGSCQNFATDCRVSARFWADPTYVDPAGGFRLVIDATKY